MLIYISPIKKLYMAGKKSQERCDAAILCSSHNIEEQKPDWLTKKLFLRFDDIVTANTQRSFSSDMANQVKDFVDSLPHDARLYICCDSGESRSSALAAATYRYLHKDEMIVWKDPHYHPNMHVYTLQCAAYGIFVSRFQKNRRQRISRKALSNAIRKGHTASSSCAYPPRA